MKNPFANRLANRLATSLSGEVNGDATPITDMGDVQTWIRPDEAFRILNGSNLSSVVNRGLLGLVADQTVADNQPLWNASDSEFNGQPSFTCDASGGESLMDWLDLPDSSALTECHLFMVGVVDAVGPTSGAGGIMTIGTAASSDHFPLSATQIFMGAGSTTRRDSLTFTQTLTNRWVLEVLSTASIYKITINNTDVIVNDGTNTVGMASAPTIGRSMGSSVGMNGRIADFILCGTEQTTAQRNFFYNDYYPRYV